jgi:hypothetical protein
VKIIEIEKRFNPITGKHEYRAYDPDSVDVDCDDCMRYYMTHAEGVGDTPEEAKADLLEKMSVI